MAPKAHHRIGSHPKHRTLCLLGLLLVIQGVVSNSEMDHDGPESSPPAYGLGAQPRMFAPTKKGTELPDSPTGNSPNKAKEDARPKSAPPPLAAPSSSKADAVLKTTNGSSVSIHRNVQSAQSNVPSQSSTTPKPPKTTLSTSATPTRIISGAMLDSSAEFQTTDPERVSVASASPLHLLTPQLLFSHRHLESSMLTIPEKPAAPPTLGSTVQTESVHPASTRPISSVAAEMASPTIEFLSSSFSPTARPASSPSRGSVPAYGSEVMGTTPTIPNSMRDVRETPAPYSVEVPPSPSEIVETLLPIAPTTASYFRPGSSIQELTTATVFFITMATDRLGSDDVPLQPSSDSQVRKEEFALPAGTVAGIVVASIGFVAILAAVVGLLLFRRLKGIGSKTYDSKYDGDNCSYLDSLQVSYINNHIELPKESSDEMFSLDNDSFLNSLEAMTMENYWAEDRRSTKV